jgi:hypothetical protein
VKQIIDDLKPRDGSIILQYTNPFNKQFCFVFTDKFPDNLEKYKERATKIEENMLSSKIKLSTFTRPKNEVKSRF